MLDNRTFWPAAPGSLELVKHADLADLWDRKHTLHVRWSLVTVVCFDEAAYPEDLCPRLLGAIELARLRPDPFVVRWVAQALESRNGANATDGQVN